MQRKTYALINGDILEKNVEEIRKKYPDYTYYFGVVKNNAYHHGMKSVLDFVKGGVNYLAVSSLEEALEARKYVKEIPILCLEPIDLEFIDDCVNHEITITVESLDYFLELEKIDFYSTLKVHLKIDSGMHRLGFYHNVEVSEVVEKIKQHKYLELEGIYSHFATSGVTDSNWDQQVEKFLEITSLIDLKEIPIVHFGRSLTLVNHEKLSFCNGIRLGIVLYGYSQSKKDGTGFKDKLRILKRKRLQKKNHCSKTILENDLHLEEAFSLYSTVMSCREVKKGDVVGYNCYLLKENGYIITIPIGYADGVTKDFGFVFLKGKSYPIVSDSMDMILVFSNQKIEIGTEVEIIGPNQSMKSLVGRTHKNAYHLLNDISNRVVRVHQREEETEEIYY